MASKDDMLFDDDIDEMDEPEQDDAENITSDKSKLDTRRRLEEYMEMKKLRELIDFQIKKTARKIPGGNKKLKLFFIQISQIVELNPLILVLYL